MKLNFMGDGTTYIIIGAALFVGSAYLPLDELKAYQQSLGDTWTANAIGLFIKEHSTIQGFFALMVMLGMALSTVGRSIKKLWEDSVQDFLDVKISQLESDLDNIREDNKKSISEISALATKRRVEELLINKDESDLKDMMKQVFSAYFGRHTLADESLLKAVNKRYSEFFLENTPHKSRYEKNITLVSSGGPGDGFIWNERCKYQIHCISMATQGATPVPYDLGYESSLIFPNGGNQKDLENYCLSIEVIDERDNCRTKLFDSKTDLIWNGTEIVPAPHCDLCEVIQDGLEFRLVIAKQIKLKGEWTSVRIHEETKLQDTTYAIHNKEPVYNQEISISLPEGWKFTEIVRSDENSQEIRRQGSEKRNVVFVARQWVLPGLSAYFAWERDPVAPEGGNKELKQVA